MTARWLLACALLAGCGSAPVRAPEYVRVLDRVRTASTSPAADSAQWRLAFLDIETTGLVPGWHEAIDLGLVVTDLVGRPVDSLFLRIQPEHPQRTSPGAAAVNGFSEARWRELGALPRAAAVDSLFAFQRRAAAGRSVLLVAFNSQFDTAFLDALLRASGRSWRELYHYFVLDIPSMAWSLGLRDLTNAALAARLGVADEPRVAEQHTGLTGALLNVRIYRALLAYRPR